MNENQDDNNDYRPLVVFNHIGARSGHATARNDRNRLYTAADPAERRQKKQVFKPKYKGTTYGDGPLE